MSKDQISQAHNSQKNLMMGGQNYKQTKKKMASDDDEMNGDWSAQKWSNHRKKTENIHMHLICNLENLNKKLIKQNLNSSIIFWVLISPI